MAKRRYNRVNPHIVTRLMKVYNVATAEEITAGMTTIRVVVGRTEGFIQSVGFISEGMPFMCRGTRGIGLHWEPREETTQAIIELRHIVAYLKAAGNVIEGLEQLDKIGG